MATAVRRTGWPNVALGLLQWAIGQGVSDQHILTDAILCHLRLDDITGAHATLNHARSRRLATDGMYAAVVDAYGRIGNVAHTQRVFDEARGDGVAAAFCRTALQDAYGKGGDLRQTQCLFDEASRDFSVG